MKLNTFGRQIVAGLLVVGALISGTGVAHAGSASSRVEAFSTNSHRVWVTAGEMVTITVLGDGDTDLDLYVYDRSGLVVSDTGGSDYCVVRFRALTSGYLDTRVENLGSVWNRYMIVVS